MIELQCKGYTTTMVDLKDFKIPPSVGHTISYLTIRWGEMSPEIITAVVTEIIHEVWRDYTKSTIIKLKYNG